MTESTLRQAILDGLDNLRTLAESLPTELPPDPPAPPDPPEPPEPPPDPPASPDELATVQHGPWEDPATWGGFIPAANTRATVMHDVTVTAGVAGRVDNHASLTLAPGGTLELHGSYVAYEGSSTTATSGRISMHVPDDRLFTANNGHGEEERSDFHPSTDIGLWFLSGSIRSLVGPEVTPFVRAVGDGNESPIRYPHTGADYGVSGRVAISSGQATLDKIPEGWQVGDTLLLAGERGQFKTAVLDSINETTLIYTPRDDGLEFSSATTIEFGDAVYFQPVIANLSRRLVFDAPLCQDGDTDHRSFIDVHRGALGEFRNAEIRNFGPRAKLGRYPIHHHHMGDASGNSVRGCSIWQDISNASDGSHRGSRSIAIHRTQNLDVSGNITLHVHGHAIFMEDRMEYGNTIANNLAVGVAGKEELAVVDMIGGVWDRAHGFWLRPSNTITNNIAIGCGIAMGVVRQRDAAGDTVTGEVAEIDGLIAIGSEQFGFWSSTEANVRNSVGANNGHVAYGDGHSFFHVNRYYDCAALINSTRRPTEPLQVLNYAARAPQEWHGGVVAGPAAFRAYRGLQWIITDATIEADHLVLADFHLFAAVVSGSKLTIGSNLIHRRIDQPIHGAAPISLLDLRNVTGTIRGSEESDLSGDWTHSHLPNAGAWAGIDTGNDRKLTDRLPVGGTVSTHWTARLLSGSSLLPADQDEPFTHTIHQYPSPVGIVELRGYPHALPPGQYVLTGEYIRGGTETRRVTVKSGQNTDWQSSPIEDTEDE